VTERQRVVSGLAALAAALVLLSACSPERESPPALALPAGALIAGDAAAFRGMLAGLEQLRGSPLARSAGVLNGRMTPCRDFSLRQQPDEPFELAALLESASCDRAILDDPAVKALRGDSDLVFALPLGEGGRIAGRVRVEGDGSLALEGEVLELPGGHLARLFAPDAGATGPRRLSDTGALVSARFQPQGGLDLASLVPGGSQADQMFRLKSGLFQGAAFAGAWEFAVYPAAEDHVMPLLAVSADLRLRSAAIAGMRDFIAELESTWPVRHQSIEFGTFEGACFFDLRILPDFAPCYVTTADAIILGWNPEAVQLALAGGESLDLASAAGATSAAAVHASELLVRLGELPAADDRLRRMLAPDAAPLELAYFWDQLAVVGGRRDLSIGPVRQAAGALGEVWLRARLRAADSAASDTGDAS
jgi:hypothetical protein